MVRFSKSLFAAPVAVVAVLALCVPTQAGGLIQQVPPDGSWVILKVDSELDIGGNLQSATRELKVSSVGKQEVDGEPARWIELSTEVGGRKMVAKLLIEEKYLKADQDSFEHVAKGWARGRDGMLAELPKERLRGLVVFAVGVPHFDKLAKKGKEKIQTELGEYECEHATGQVEREGFQGNKAKFDGELWTCDKVPFGLVKAKVKVDFTKGSIESELTAVRSGSDAKSELPDAK